MSARITPTTDLPAILRHAADRSLFRESGSGGCGYLMAEVSRQLLIAMKIINEGQLKRWRRVDPHDGL